MEWVGKRNDRKFHRLTYRHEDVSLWGRFAIGPSAVVFFEVNKFYLCVE